MPLTDNAACDLVLYTHPWSRGQIARWMVEETGAPYRQVILPFGPPMKTPDYLALNPMGKVPTLVHGAQVVSECAAICAYLADAFPAAQLAPPPAQRAAYYRWLFFAAGPLEAAVVDRKLGVQIEEAQQGMVGYGSYERVMDTLAGLLARAPYVGGPTFSAADLYLGAQIIWGLQFGTLPRRAEFEAYAARLTQRPAYQRAKALDTALGAELAPRRSS